MSSDRKLRTPKLYILPISVARELLRLHEEYGIASASISRLMSSVASRKVGDRNMFTYLVPSLEKPLKPAPLGKEWKIMEQWCSGRKLKGHSFAVSPPYADILGTLVIQ